MNGYGEFIRDGLKEKRVSIINAALWLGVTRQGLYKKLKDGNFFIGEVGVLIERGVLSKKKVLSLLTDRPLVCKSDFKIKDAVICTLKDAEWTSNDGKIIDGPKYKEECVISGIDDKSGDLLLFEYPIKEGFWSGAFKKAND
jgi:hypothetical protein